MVNVIEALADSPFRLYLGHNDGGVVYVGPEYLRAGGCLTSMFFLLAAIILVHDDLDTLYILVISLASLELAMPVNPAANPF